MRALERRAASGAAAFATGAGALFALPVLRGVSDLEKISPLVWVMVAISAGGAIITYAFLVYAAWRFRDPATRRRNYG